MVLDTSHQFPVIPSPREERKDQYIQSIDLVDFSIDLGSRLWIPIDPSHEPDSPRGQGWKIAEGMLSSKVKEHALLRSRLTLLTHIEDLLHKGSIFKKEKPAVRANVKAILDANIDLPFDIRLKLLQRYTEDAFREMKTTDQPDNLPVNKLLESWITMVPIDRIS